MGSFDKLEIGRRSLFAAQMGQRTTGQNIANVNTEGYRKQTLDQSDFYSEKTGKMNGVSVDGIKRAHDELLERKITSANAEYKNENTRSELLRGLEVIFDDRNGRGLSNLITRHWAAWDELATSPESLPLRAQLVERAENLADKFTSLNQESRSYQKQISNDIQNDVDDINRWAANIADLNYKIVTLDARGENTNGLKDERDRMANLISDKIDVNRSYNKNGRLHLQIGKGHALVDGDSAFRLKFNHDEHYSNKVSVSLQLQETSQLDITGFTRNGEMREKIRMVNEYIPDALDRLDVLADDIRLQVNRIYSSGTPLGKPFLTLESASVVPAPYINERIPQLKAGEVTFAVTDADGDPVDTVSITVQESDTAFSIMDKINASAQNEDNKAAGDYLRADIVGEHFQIAAKPGQRFYISQDETGAMAQLGLNVFFSGHWGAEDFSVAHALKQNSDTVAAGRDLLPGNNTVALGIGDLKRATPMDQGTKTYDEYYDRFSADLALDLQTSTKKSEIKKETLDQYNVMREEISGVSLDEEMSNIIRYQRAYEASAKFSSAADQMLQTVINIR